MRPPLAVDHREHREGGLMLPPLAVDHREHGEGGVMRPPLAVDHREQQKSRNEIILNKKLIFCAQQFTSY
jgi:hypothetical protein